MHAIIETINPVLMSVKLATYPVSQQSIMDPRPPIVVSIPKADPAIFGKRIPAKAREVG